MLAGWLEVLESPRKSWEVLAGSSPKSLVGQGSRGSGGRVAQLPAGPRGPTDPGRTLMFLGTIRNSYELRRILRITKNYLELLRSTRNS